MGKWKTRFSSGPPISQCASIGLDLYLAAAGGQQALLEHVSERMGKSLYLAMGASQCPQERSLERKGGCRKQFTTAYWVTWGKLQLLNVSEPGFLICLTEPRFSHLSGRAGEVEIFLCCRDANYGDGAWVVDVTVPSGSMHDDWCTWESAP